MIEVLVVNGVIYENLEEVVYVPTAYDENGVPTAFEQQPNPIIPTSREELITVIKNTVLWLHKKWVDEFLRSNGYFSLGDLLIYSEDTQDLLNTYKTVDSRAWSFIDSLETKTDEELKEVMRNLRSIFDEITKT